MVRSATKALGYFQDRVMVDPATGCWVWAHYRKPDGYGQFNYAGRAVLAHRAAFEAVNGVVPEGMCVCHRCDNPPCVNPDHLFLGTHADNMRDMSRKGRSGAPQGERHGAAKLSEHDVSVIKILLDLGVKQHRLATLYGVSKASVSNINTGRKWASAEPLKAR